MKQICVSMKKQATDDILAKALCENYETGVII